jgi:hypothetical protein
MMSFIKKAIAASLCPILLLPLFIFASALGGDSALLSPGLSVIASSCDLTVSITPNGEAAFTAEDFYRATGKEDLGHITIQSRPEASGGQLTIGSIVIPSGQTVRAANLSRMSFCPADGAKHGDSATFTYTADDSPYLFTCKIIISDDAASNSAPTLDTATSAALTGAAYSGYPYGGLLAGSDPDGDALRYTLTSYPKHGSVILTNSQTGEYIYTSEDGYSGKDSFSYTLCDKYGNYADGEARVNISVSRYLPSVKYTDVSGKDLSAVMTVSAAGIMGGSALGEGYYFYPAESISRVEFLVALMSAAGIDELPDASATVFADDGDIPNAMRPYVAAAYELGYTHGWVVDGKQCFLPNEKITTAEAASLTAAMLGLSLEGEVPASVGNGAPAWARNAVCAMAQAGFPLGERIGASEKLDRIGAAHLLCAVMRYCA